MCCPEARLVLCETQSALDVLNSNLNSSARVAAVDPYIELEADLNFKIKAHPQSSDIWMFECADLPGFVEAELLMGSALVSLLLSPPCF